MTFLGVSFDIVFFSSTLNGCSVLNTALYLSYATRSFLSTWNLFSALSFSTLCSSNAGGISPIAILFFLLILRYWATGSFLSYISAFALIYGSKKISAVLSCILYIMYAAASASRYFCSCPLAGLKSLFFFFAAVIASFTRVSIFTARFSPDFITLKCLVTNWKIFLSPAIAFCESIKGPNLSVNCFIMLSALASLSLIESKLRSG